MKLEHPVSRHPRSAGVYGFVDVSFSCVLFLDLIPALIISLSRASVSVSQRRAKLKRTNTYAYNNNLNKASKQAPPSPFSFPPLLVRRQEVISCLNDSQVRALLEGNYRSTVH